MKEKLVKLTELKDYKKFTMHDRKCVWKNDDERVLLLFEYQHTSVMTPCCKFETGRTQPEMFESMTDRMGRNY